MPTYNLPKTYDFQQLKNGSMIGGKRAAISNLPTTRISLDLTHR